MLRHPGARQGPTLDYLRDSIGVATAALDAGGVAVLDPQRVSWYAPAAWRANVFEAGPRPEAHVVILSSEDEGDATRLWFHTRGMRKLGRPDISLRVVPRGSQDAAIELCNRLIAVLARGGVIPDGKPITMKSLPDGLRVVHGGNVDDPDFNNVHVEVRWPK